MGEPLKNFFGPDVAVRIGDMINGAYPEFDRAAYLETALGGFDDLELMPGARHISKALAEYLPGDPEKAIQIVIDSLEHEPPLRNQDEDRPTGMDTFRYMPLVCFVSENGLDCFETSMQAQYELTQLFTAEFSIRAFLDRYPEKTLARLRRWAADPNHHVRRLVSEGTRPRLPWAPRLRGFQDDPMPVLELLELLKDDTEEYVRRSVANNLNDISKDHPSLVVDVARRWWKGGSENRKRLVRHGLRTLVKAGDPGALDVLGFSVDTPAVVASVTCAPSVLGIGEKVRIEAEIVNPSGRVAPVLVDLRVHFVKSSGTTNPKVFKGTKATLEPGESVVVRKTVSLAQHTTRKHYPGDHRVDVVLNGGIHPGGHFELK